MPKYRIQLRLSFKELDNIISESSFYSGIFDFPNTIHTSSSRSDNVEYIKLKNENFPVSEIEHILDQNYSLIKLSKKFNHISRSTKNYIGEIDKIVKEYEKALLNLSKKEGDINLSKKEGDINLSKKENKRRSHSQHNKYVTESRTKNKPLINKLI
ncbi:MAG: hypothetical protein PHD81_03860 [Candidatus Nanoarchaeia archaeon]|nr:hypothetical protein [Candidatus Nanoarchaeia archaeon]MDD5588218.1 hypothetical protein [Candidatus Nanoarchaeia archaeon]